jgi:hypothetical protein
MRSLVQGYDELRLRIERLKDGPYRVHASTRSAEASAEFELPFNELELENFILKVSRPRGRRRIDSSATGDARRFGGSLFKAVFRDQIYDLYHDAVVRARSQGRGVRITLCLSGSPELIDVPWEYLFDDPDFLAVSAFTPVVRYLDLPREHRPLVVERPLRVLGLVSSPAEYERLDVERERENLQRALSGLIEIGAVELHWLEPPTLGALLTALQTRPFHALHYVGHGAYDREAERGILIFEDGSGWAHPVSGDKLGMILHDFSSLQLAVLNACEGARTSRNDPFTGVAGALVQRDIPAVVAMQFEISDEAAIVFAGGFYRPLAAGAPVDESLAAARLAMLAERSEDIEWGTPVLFMRVADGKIFDLGQQPEQQAPALPPMSATVPTTNGPATARPGDGLPIFINYRGDDTPGHALLLRDRLGQHFGQANVHLTFDDRSGNDRLAQLGNASVFLALIGPAWVSSLKAASATRHTEDVARRELERALRDLPESVIPVLIDTTMPDPDTLPRSLRGLCRKEWTELRHASFDADLTALVARIARVAAGSGRPATPDPRRHSGAAQKRRAPTRSGTGGAVGVPQPYDDHYRDVIGGMLEGAVVPLLGPGVRGALPSSDHLAARLAEQFDTDSPGLAGIAQRVAVTLGERRLYTAIKDLVTAQSEPSDVDRFLAAFPSLLRQRGLPPRHQLIIDANYDSGLERAFEAANEPFDYAVYVASSGWFVHVPWGEHASEPIATTILEPRTYVDFPIDDSGQLERTIIIRIHGGADGREGGVAWRNNYVVTEDHYIDYLPTNNIQDHIPIQILDKLTGSRCLFLGYLIGNWDARVFFRRIWRGKPFSENSWAIEQGPDLLEKASWSAVGHVELLASSFPEYVDQLFSTLLGWPGPE